MTLVFKGNMFDLLPNERTLISDLSITVQRFQQAPATPGAEEKNWP